VARGARGRGECVAPSGASSGEQVSRRWPGLSGARLCLLAEEDDERRGRWAGLVKLGRLQVSGPGRLLSLSLFLIMLLFSIYLQLFGFIKNTYALSKIMRLLVAIIWIISNNQNFSS